MGNRFKGWTEKAVSRFVDDDNFIISKKENTFINTLADELSKKNFVCIKEYKFLKDRRFRFDLALPQHKIAIEYEGGVWSNGRHTRGKGYISDIKKYNLATMHGWKLLRYTTEDTKQKNWQIKVADEIINFVNKNSEQGDGKIQNC